MLWLKNVISTDLLQRFHGYLCEYNVDFIGGDFNMSAFSTVSDVFSDPEILAPGRSCLWGLGRWMNNIVSALGFSSQPSVHMSGVSTHMAATSLTMRYLTWDLETNLLIFRCSFTFTIPIFPDPAASCEVTKHNKEDLSAYMTKNLCRDDVHPEHSHDCAPFLQCTLIDSYLNF